MNAKINNVSRLTIILVVFGTFSVSAAKRSLPTLASATNKEALEAKIEKAQSTVKAFNAGYVVIGRVVLDGPGDPRDVKAQMEILPAGYFAGETKETLAEMVQYANHASAGYNPRGRIVENDFVYIIHQKH